MNVSIWSYSMLVIILAIPLYCLWEGNKTELAVVSGEQSKLEAYASTMVLLWLPTLYLVIGLYSEQISTVEISLVWVGSTNNWLGALGVLALTGYFALNLIMTKNAKETHPTLEAQLEHVAWLMPRSPKELMCFTCGVSLSAGICEELLFRGFLWFLMTPFLGFWPALLVSSLLFGLAHAYQGGVHVLRTGVMGIILGVISWLTGTIWIAIAVHALVNIYGGLLAYIVCSSTKPEQARSVTDAC